MAGRTVLGCGLVEQNHFGAHGFGELVALSTLHVLVRSPQGECGPLLMVEQRGLPLHAVVAVGTGRGVCLGELLSVDVLVAVLA